MLKVRGVDDLDEFFAGCETVADRQLAMAKVVEPHGFCVACMLHCHEGHDVHELYSKLDFRCDCGNSRMPLACSIKAGDGDVAGDDLGPSEVEDRNSENRYTNLAFFDLYCLC